MNANRIAGVIIIFVFLALAAKPGNNIATPDSPTLKMKDEKMLKLKTYKSTYSTGPESTEKNKVTAQIIIRNIDLSKTALVCLDLWDGLVSPDSSCFKNTMSLINLARKYNIQIIHVPHLPWERYSYNWNTWQKGEPIVGFQEPKWTFGMPIIGQSAESLPSNPYEVMDPILKENGFTTLLYTGYSVQWCMLGRPNGMPEMAKRGNYEMILVKDCTDPNDSNHKQYAHDFFEAKFETTTLTDIIKSLGDNEFQAVPSLKAKNYDILEIPEKKFDLDFGKDFTEKELFSKTAVIVINAWDSHPNRGWALRMKENNGRIAKFIEWAREKEITIVHVSNGGSLDTRCKPEGKEKLISSELDLSKYLVSIGFPIPQLSTDPDYSVIYVGNLMNTTPQFNGATHGHWYPGDGDYHYPITCNKKAAEDCIICFESPESYYAQIMKKQFLALFGNTGSSIIDTVQFRKNTDAGERK